MIQSAVIGLGAGLAAALLFGSMVSGSLAAVLLFYLAPLPILVAALGWSHGAALIAAASATAIVAIFSGVFLAAAAVVSFGAWWLGYLTLLARPTSERSAADLEWYPVGRLVLWAAAIGTLLVAVAASNFGTDQDSLRAGLHRSYGRLVNDQKTIEARIRSSTGRGSVLHVRQSAQSLARGMHREGLRPAETAVAGFDGVHASPCNPWIACRRDRGILSARSLRHSVERLCRKPDDGICYTWLCRASFGDAGNERSRGGPCQRIRDGGGIGLAPSPDCNRRPGRDLFQHPPARGAKAQAAALADLTRFQSKMELHNGSDPVGTRCQARSDG
jgi:hypothetical protein